MAEILLFTLLAAAFTSPAMTSSDSSAPWFFDIDFSGHWLFVKYNSLILWDYLHPLVSFSGINKSISFQL